MMFEHGDFTAREVIDRLAPHVTDARLEKIQRVASQRTLQIHTVLDGIYDRGNASAVMRSVEAMGFFNVHMIETQEKFKAANRVTQGTDKWLNIQKWSDPAECMADLKSKGLQIVATDLDAAVPLESIDFTIPTAIVLGNERDGISDAVREAADAKVIIPMAGMAQSFNISVAGAITLYHIALHRRKSLHKMGDVSPEEIEMITAEYLYRSVESSDRLLDLIS